jgi:hypothetical protein
MHALTTEVVTTVPTTADSSLTIQSYQQISSVASLRNRYCLQPKQKIPQDLIPLPVMDCFLVLKVWSRKKLCIQSQNFESQSKNKPEMQLYLTVATKAASTGMALQTL